MFYIPPVERAVSGQSRKLAYVVTAASSFVIPNRSLQNLLLLALEQAQLFGKSGFAAIAIATASVFSRSWLRLLRLGGMSYKRAVRVTRQLSRLIDAFRTDVARIRHDRARQERDASGTYGGAEVRSSCAHTNALLGRRS